MRMWCAPGLQFTICSRLQRLKTYSLCFMWWFVYSQLQRMWYYLRFSERSMNTCMYIQPISTFILKQKQNEQKWDGLLMLFYAHYLNRDLAISMTTSYHISFEISPVSTLMGYYCMMTDVKPFSLPRADPSWSFQQPPVSTSHNPKTVESQRGFGSGWIQII